MHLLFLTKFISRAYVNCSFSVEVDWKRFLKSLLNLQIYTSNILKENHIKFVGKSQYFWNCFQNSSEEKPFIYKRAVLKTKF